MRFLWYRNHTISDTNGMNEKLSPDVPHWGRSAGLVTVRRETVWFCSNWSTLPFFSPELFKRFGAAGGEGWIMLHKGENLWEDVVWGEG